ncbi:hypothetical protein [Fusobacterium sp. PH5-44]|uniref:hypothetical protein n=1 Tax=unclassified Fusobacterium TaxID=2648384 RepID=UPI003D1CA36D
MKKLSLMFMFVNLLIFCNNKRSFSKNKNFTQLFKPKITFPTNHTKENFYKAQEVKNKNLLYKEKNGKEFDGVTSTSSISMLDDKNIPKLSQGKFRIRIDEILNNRNTNSNAINNTRNELSKAINKFEEIQKYIGVRLYSKEYISYIGEENLITMKITDDIYAALIMDYPNTIKNIFPAQIKPWQKTIGQLFDIGIKNIKEKYNFTIKDNKILNYNTITIEEEHFFVPNIIFELEKREDLVGINGVLIGLPSRHCAIMYPLNGENIKDIAPQIIPQVKMIYEKGQGSLSNNLYWYNNRKIIDVSNIVDSINVLV